MAVAYSSMVLQVGTYINIRNKTWMVDDVSFFLDQADKPFECGMWCNINLKET